MKYMKKILIIFGTRPEAIKMIPLILEMESSKMFKPIVVVTGQHRDMLDQVLELFEITPAYDLNIMKENQTLADTTQMILENLGDVLEIEKPDMVFVHGDTTTTFASALAAFYKQMPIGHVEAGLRTWDKHSPFPEEMNRQMTDVLSDIYFAPTTISKKNLVREGHIEKRIFVTGNTAIDMMNYTIQEKYENLILEKGKRTILVTMHRRENIGQPMIDVCQAINELIAEFPDVNVIFPIHKNPKVRNLVASHLSQSKQVKLIEPLSVNDFHNVLSRCYLVLTDSGGVQEEAPYTGVPVLVLRNTTERPEGVAAGTLKLIGTQKEMVYKEVKELLVDASVYEKMSGATNPYGDGHASKYILEALANYFHF